MEANRVLKQVKNLLNLPPRAKTEVVAELRAVRTFYHYLLMDNFGSILLITTFESGKSIELVPRGQAYEFVILELREAIPNLSIKVDKSTYGRMTRWAAKTLLAQVYLNSEVYTETSNYDKVITLADEIIDSGNYRLDPDYRGPFVRDNQK